MSAEQKREDRSSTAAHTPEVSIEDNRYTGGHVRIIAKTDVSTFLFREAYWNLELDVRGSRLLREYGIKYVGDLVILTEEELLSYLGFGRKTVDGIKKELAQHGLQLGTDIPGWPPPHMEETAKRFEEDY